MTVTVGKRRSDSTTPSPRVLTAADAAGLGEWERSDAPNADNGSGTGWFVAAAGVPLIAAWFVIPALYFGSGAVNDNPWGWALVISGALAAVVTVAVCGMRGVSGCRRRPHPPRPVAGAPVCARLCSRSSEGAGRRIPVRRDLRRSHRLRELLRRPAAPMGRAGSLIVDVGRIKRSDFAQPRTGVRDPAGDAMQAKPRHNAATPPTGCRRGRGDRASSHLGVSSP